MKLAIILISLYFFTALTVLAQGRLNSSVVDDAQILDSTRREQLLAMIRDLKLRRSIWLVVHTLETLDGEPIEDYSERRFREWQIGEKGKDNGLLLVLAMGDRKMRLEVGYGLEGELTDYKSKDLLERILKPKLKAGQTFNGIVELIEALGAKKESTTSEANATASDLEMGIGLPKNAIITFTCALVPMTLFLWWRRQRRRLRENLSAIGVLELPIEEHKLKQFLTLFAGISSFIPALVVVWDIFTFMRTSKLGGFNLIEVGLALPLSLVGVALTFLIYHILFASISTSIIKDLLLRGYFVILVHRYPEKRATLNELKQRLITWHFILQTGRSRSARSSSSGGSTSGSSGGGRSGGGGASSGW